jgi:drug/metabolite transporter (DMT)-like permease
VITALIALPFATPAAVDGGDALALAVMGLVMLPLSFAMMAVGPRYIPAPEVSLTLLLESVLGPLWVWLALGEDPGEATLLGGAIVIAALAGNAAAALRRERP